MFKPSAHLAHAQSLLADMQAAPEKYIPRRDIIADWLHAFMARARTAGYELGETEVNDLAALEKFLRGKDVAIAVRARS